MTEQSKRAPAAPQRRPAPQGRPVQGRPAAARPAAARPAARPAQPRSAKAGGSDTLRLIAICAAMIAIAVALQCIWPSGFPLFREDSGKLEASMQVSEIYSEGPLRINEVMSSNRETLSQADGESPDWIEIMNISNKAVNLGGYTLSKTANDVRTFTFPEMTLEAGQCVLVYADSRLRDTAGEELHAPFRISSAGDTLMLFNAGGSAVDTVNIAAMGSDQSYARMDTRAWQVSEMPTPGLANSRENYEMLKRPADYSPVIISELMSTNTKSYADENGAYYDYIELYNCSAEAVNLDGWYLSDDETQLRKWRMPAVTIESGQCLVVHASKLDRREDPAHLHTNFGLSSEGETVLLVGKDGRIMDRVDFDLLKADVAMTLNADGTWSTASATPGKYN